MRPIAAAELAVDEIAERVVEARSRLQELRERPGRFVVTLQSAQRIAATVDRFGKAGPQAQRAVGARERLVGTLQREQRIGAIGVRVGKVGPRGDRPVEARQRLLRAPQRGERVAAVVERGDVVRLERKRALVARERLVVPLHRQTRVAEVVVRLRIAGIERQRALEASECLRRAPALGERDAEVRQRGSLVRISRIDVDRPADQVDRILVGALLHPGDSKEVQRVEMHGSLREDLAIEGLGLRELAALVMADGALEQRRDRRRRRPLSDGFPGAMFDHCRCCDRRRKRGLGSRSPNLSNATTARTLDYDSGAPRCIAPCPPTFPVTSTSTAAT